MQKNAGKKGAAENPNRARTLYYINILFLCALALVSLLFAMIVYFRLRTRGTDGVRKLYTQKQIEGIREEAAKKEKRELLLQIQTSLESGRGTTRMLREIFTDSIVVENDGQYYFYPLAEGVERNPLAPASLVRREDDILYEGASPAVGLTPGILLSDENGKIDWDRLAGSRAAEATIRAGTVTEKGFVPDIQFERNCRKAAEQGMPVRMCIEVKSPARDGALEGAVKVLRRCAGSYGIRRDAADAPREKAPAAGTGEEAEDGTAGPGAGPEDGSGGALEPTVLLRLTAADLLPDEGGDGEAWTACVQRLCRLLEKEGLEPVLGAGPYAFAARLDMKDLGSHARWLVDHGDAADFPYRFSYWEYSAQGRVEGVPASSVLYVRLCITDDIEVLEDAP